MRHYRDQQSPEATPTDGKRAKFASALPIDTILPYTDIPVPVDRCCHPNGPRDVRGLNAEPADCLA